VHRSARRQTKRNGNPPDPCLAALELYRQHAGVWPRSSTRRSLRNPLSQRDTHYHALAVWLALIDSHYITYAVCANVPEAVPLNRTRPQRGCWQAPRNDGTVNLERLRSLTRGELDDVTYRVASFDRCFVPSLDRADFLSATCRYELSARTLEKRQCIWMNPIVSVLDITRAGRPVGD